MNPLKKKQHRLFWVGVAGALFLIMLPVLFPMSGKPGPNGMAALGRFHILTLHFPIALVMLVPVLEVLTRMRRLADLKNAIYPLLVLATFSSIIVSMLGLVLALGDGFSGKLVIDHMWGGIITSILLITTLLLKERQQHTSGMGLLAAYIITLGFCVLSLISTSHHGASLVHGADYLYEKLPPGLQPFFGATEQRQGITADSNVYDDLIQPIFRSHCYGCHSIETSKGGFRMDDFERLLSGGNSGTPGIEPGNLDDSEVHYRITLPPSTKAFMPPTGRQPLTEEQVALIAWWIESGASAEATIADVLQLYPSELVRGQLNRFSAQ